MKFVDPKTDIAFKKIFGDEAHKNILIEFLNDVLELEHPLADVSIRNTYQPPHLYRLKDSHLDIKAKDQAGREFIIEMQVEKELAFAKRAQYYSSKAYSQQLAKAEHYHLLKPVIFLGILDFTVFDHPQYCSRHLLLNNNSQQQDLKDLEFNFVELPKFTKTETELASAADKWIYFIKHADNLDHIPGNADIPALQQAYQIAARHHWTPDELDVYESQGIELTKARGMVETAHLEGKLEGRLEGQQETQCDIARKLLAVLDDAAIAQATGLSAAAIAELRQHGIN